MDRAAVADAASRGGLVLGDDVDVVVTGDDPALRSPLRLGLGAATARVLTGVGAARLMALRRGRTPRVTVDAVHAALSLTSFRHTTLLDSPDVARADPRALAQSVFTRILPTGDGRYVQLHGSFHDGPAVAGVLGLAADATAEMVASAVAERDARELEAALTAAGLCGGVVYSQAEWREHPQGRALVGLPVVRITRVGDAAPEPLPEGDRATDGVRVLDVTRVLAGPTVAKVLAEHGADVLHVTSPRALPLPAFDLDTGLGKRQTTLDPDRAADRERLRALAATADIVCQGFRPGVIARSGLEVASLADARPGIIYVSESCYGTVGPWADRPGWEQLAQAASGMSFAEGLARQRPPQLAPAAVNDYSTGWLAAYGAMEALRRRATEGGSWLVEASLVQTASWYLGLGDELDHRLAPEADPEPFMVTTASAHYGPVRHLRPALELDGVTPVFDRGPAPPGTDEPRWIAD